MTPSICVRLLAKSASALSAMVLISCGSSGGGGGNTPPPPPAAPLISSFSVAKSPITRGGSATLNPIFSNGTGSINNSVGIVNSNVPAMVSPTVDTTYTLTVTNSASVSVTQSATVAVVAPPDQPVITSPTIATAGAINLTASVPDQPGCSFSWSIIGGSITAGGDNRSLTFTAGPTGTLTLSCTATNAAGTASAPGTILVSVVAAPVITSFTSAALQITGGSGTTLTAVFIGGTGSIDHGIGKVSSGGAVPTGNLSVDTTYLLTVTNPAGDRVTALTTVAIVGPPTIVSFTAAKNSITAGSGTTLTALFSGGIGSIDHGIGTVSSGVAVATGNLAITTTYTLTVTNSLEGSAAKTLTVTVDPALAISQFTASPNTITSGSSSNLVFVFTGGAGSIDQGVGAVTSTIQKTVSPLASTIYTLTITNTAGNTLTATTQVTVVSPSSITSFTAASSPIQAGTATTLTGVFANGTSNVDKGVGALSSGVAKSTGVLGATTTFTLTVTNAAGDSVRSTVTVTVVPPPTITSFSAAKNPLTMGSSTTLMPIFSGGTGSMDNGIGAVTSSVGLSTGVLTTTRTYTLTVTNSLGATSTESVTITVVPLPSITSFTAGSTSSPTQSGRNLTAVFSGGTAVANPGGILIISGVTKAVNPAITARYELVVTNPAGDSVKASVEVYQGLGISGGGSHSLVLKSDGTLWAWGSNSNGELGDGTWTDRTAPEQLNSLTGVISMAAGGFHSLAVKEDGTVWNWGFGLKGDGTWANRVTPVQVSSLAGIVAVAGGSVHSLALKSDGTVWAWGANSFGQLGNGTTTDQPSPVQVSGLTDVVAIAAGNIHSLALKNDGTVWAWGWNADGQLGDGTTTDQHTPVQVGGLTGVVAIGGGNGDSFALKFDGTVWQWGAYPAHSPTQISGLTGVIAVAGNSEHYLALKSDGTVWAWGWNFYGQLGDGTTTDHFGSPAQVTGISGAMSVATGSGHSLALKNDGTIWAWGWDEYGQAGDGFPLLQTIAQAVALSSVTNVAGGEGYSLALKAGGTVWGWGESNLMQLGEGLDRSIPGQISGLTGILTVVAGLEHSVALKNDGTVWAWGMNYHGLGDGSSWSSASPIEVSGLTGIIALAGRSQHNLALKNDGTVWAWGANGNGQLGDGTTSDRSIPVQVNGLTGVIHIAVGLQHSLAVTSDGTVWEWGSGFSIESHTAVQVGGLTGAVAVAAGNMHSLALKSDGTVWAWGFNGDGELGDGTTTSRSTPVQVIGLAGVNAVAAGQGHSLALKSDGTVWAAGWNIFGQLGDGTTTDRLTPVRVSGLTGVTALAAGSIHSLAVGPGGVKAWGDDHFGRLGIGRPLQFTTPQQVPLFTLW